jgi:hypothetical protein
MCSLFYDLPNDLSNTEATLALHRPELYLSMHTAALPISSPLDKLSCAERMEHNAIEVFNPPSVTRVLTLGFRGNTARLNSLATPYFHRRLITPIRKQEFW